MNMGDKMNDKNKYADIINLPHHTSETRPHMSMHDRAVQFSPFAALTGHNEALDETARLTDVFIELDEDEKQILDAKIHVLMDNINEKPEITVTYFTPDEKKDGGKYVRLTGYIKKIDTLKREITMDNGAVISADYINDICGKIFDKLIY